MTDGELFQVLLEQLDKRSKGRHGRQRPVSWEDAVAALTGRWSWVTEAVLQAAAERVGLREELIHWEDHQDQRGLGIPALRVTVRHLTDPPPVEITGYGIT